MKVKAVLRRNWRFIFCLSVLVMLLLMLLGIRKSVAMIPLIIMAAVVGGFIPFLAGLVSGFLINSALAGSLFVIGLLLVWVFAKGISYGEFVLNRVTVLSMQGVIVLILSIVWYGICGSIGGDVGSMLRKKIKRDQERPTDEVGT